MLNSCKISLLVGVGLWTWLMGAPGDGSARFASPLGMGTGFAQQDAGYLADIQDRQMTVTYSSTENRTDVTLSLVPPSPNGEAGVTLILRASFDGREADLDHLTGIVVRAHYRVLSDDGVRSARALEDTHALRMRVESSRAGAINLFFYPMNWGYGGSSATGDQIPVAYFNVTPADLGALGVGDAVAGHVLWSDFVLTPEQVEALREFARQVVSPPTP